MLTKGAIPSHMSRRVAASAGTLLQIAVNRVPTMLTALDAAATMQATARVVFRPPPSTCGMQRGENFEGRTKSD